LGIKYVAIQIKNFKFEKLGITKMSNQGSIFKFTPFQLDYQKTPDGMVAKAYLQQTLAIQPFMAQNW
jgi:hypothetical protein